MNFCKPFIHLYHRILGLFFDFDLGVYAFKPSEVPVNRITDFEYKLPVMVNEITPPKFKAKTYKLKPPTFITYICPSLNDMLVLHNFTEELYNSLRIKEETMHFTCVPRFYDVKLDTETLPISTNLVFKPKTYKASKKEIYISRSLKTIEEILELEPYTKKYPVKKVLDVPITKYPVKKEKFSENQIETMRTKLAIQAKCKKYSMVLENVYDKFPVGLYEEIKIEKDASVSCAFVKKSAEIGEMQFLITGKRKYDTQTTKTFIKYSEIGLS